MTFVSYAQNFEDVLLWRALKRVEKGFYIDVGAADPAECSVTRAFYDRGWRGINIEPNQQYFTELIEFRSRDVNLQVAIGEREGSYPFFVVPDTGLSTLCPDVAAQHMNAGWSVHETRVDMMTLAEVCRRHAPPEFHLLKIDVEGAEPRVLAGADFDSFRPWIVLVEATRPLSAEAAHESWEPMLIGSAYRHVWFDGLNRFYLAAERYAELHQHFRIPPNVFDDFIRFDHAKAALEARLGEEHNARAALEGHLSEERNARAVLEARLAVVEARLAVLAAPLRGVRRAARWIVHGSMPG
jgi:FkbM family methyltransferase